MVWFENAGISFNEVNIKMSREWLSGVLEAAEIPAPYIYPSPDGSIECEWSLGFWEVACSLDFNLGYIFLRAHHRNSAATSEDRLPLNKESVQDTVSFF